MADDRRAKTMNLSGNEYAKVAERLKLFRSDFPHSKTETNHEYDVDKTVIFTVWVWKDKKDYIDVLKEVKDPVIARGSADANGTAKGNVGQKKDFEKLETIALGRALAMLGYLASGEIASSEEMEEFEKFREEQQQQQIHEAIAKINAAKDNEELNKVIQEISAVLKFPDVVKAGQAKRAELGMKPAEKPQEAPKPRGGKQVAPAAEKPAEEPTSAPALPLEDEADAHS